MAAMTTTQANVIILDSQIIFISCHVGLRARRLRKLDLDLQIVKSNHSGSTSEPTMHLMLFQIQIFFTYNSNQCRVVTLDRRFQN